PTPASSIHHPGRAEARGARSEVEFSEATGGPGGRLLYRPAPATEFDKTRPPTHPRSSRPTPGPFRLLPSPPNYRQVRIAIPPRLALNSTPFPQNPIGFVLSRSSALGDGRQLEGPLRREGSGSGQRRSRRVWWRESPRRTKADDLKGR